MCYYCIRKVVIALELMTSSELAKKLNVTMMSLNRWRKEGMPHIKIGYNACRYDYEEVVEWLKQRGKNAGFKNNL